MLPFYTVAYGGTAVSQGYHLADLVVAKSFSETETQLRGWLKEAGFEFRNLPAAGDFVWWVEATDKLGHVVALQKVEQPNVVYVACHVDLRGYDGRLAQLPDAFLYDLRLGLLLMGVDELGVLAHPLQALNPSIPLYLDGLTWGDLAAAIQKVRQAAAYITVTFDKFTGVPVLRERAAEGPAN